MVVVIASAGVVTPAAGDDPLRGRPAQQLPGLRDRPGRPGAPALDADREPQPAEQTRTVTARRNDLHGPLDRASSSTTSPRPPPAPAATPRPTTSSHLGRHLAGHGKRPTGADESIVSPSNGSLDPTNGTLLLGRSTRPGNGCRASRSPAAGRRLQRQHRRQRLRHLPRPAAAATTPSLRRRPGWSTPTAIRRGAESGRASNAGGTNTGHAAVRPAGHDRSQLQTTGSAAPLIQSGEPADSIAIFNTRHGQSRQDLRHAAAATADPTIKATSLFPFTSKYTSTPAPARKTTRTRGNAEAPACRAVDRHRP